MSCIDSSKERPFQLWFSLRSLLIPAGAWTKCTPLSKA
ncbi:hypothetical protein LINPERPRIM_LOCUS21678 [Linum perenne]